MLALTSLDSLSELRRQVKQLRLATPPGLLEQLEIARPYLEASVARVIDADLGKYSKTIELEAKSNWFRAGFSIFCESIARLVMIVGRDLLADLNDKAGVHVINSIATRAPESTYLLEEALNVGPASLDMIFNWMKTSSGGANSTLNDSELEDAAAPHLLAILAIVEAVDDEFFPSEGLEELCSAVFLFASQYLALVRKHFAQESKPDDVLDGVLEECHADLEERNDCASASIQ
jgi:hypothetical protein